MVLKYCGTRYSDSGYRVKLDIQISKTQISKYPDIQNPDIQNPDIQNPDIKCLVIKVGHPDIECPVMEAGIPDIESPVIECPDIKSVIVYVWISILKKVRISRNPDIESSSYRKIHLDALISGYPETGVPIYPDYVI